MKIGEIRNNNKGTPMRIIAMRSSNDIDVEFLDNHHYIKTHTTSGNFKKGQIKNPYDKTIFGLGYLGEGNYIGRGHLYNIWQMMLRRCHDINAKEKFPTYYNDCSVCEEWLNFQTFAEWHEQNKYECKERLHLDKDILYPGNKIYSPYHCLLVPQRINMLFTNKQNKRKMPNGVKIESGKYVAFYNGNELGKFNTIDEAYNLYAGTKKATIIKIANEYKSIIPDRVFQALLDYEVKIENDKNWEQNCV